MGAILHRCWPNTDNDDDDDNTVSGGLIASSPREHPLTARNIGRVVPITISLGTADGYLYFLRFTF